MIESGNPNKTNIGVGMPQDLWLHEFASHLWFAFDEVPYHVGSSLTGKTWRDVDVRVMLPDEKYAEMGFGDPNMCHQNGKWVAMCLAFSELGKRMTGLPIDFQIQQRSKANSEYQQQRSALGIIPLRMARMDKD